MHNKGICDTLRGIIRTSDQKQWTAPALFEEVKKAGHPFARKQIFNAVHRGLAPQGLLIDSGEFLDRAIIFDVAAEETKTADEIVFYIKEETIEKSPATVVAEIGVEKENSKRLEELHEEQLRERIKGLQATITELEDKENLSLITLGRVIERALVDKATKINQLESQLRETAAKQAKIHSEDRGQISSLRRRILELEAEVWQLRESIKRTEGITFRDKPINIKALIS